MVSVKSFIPAVATAVISTAAFAADLPPPPPIAYPPPPVVEASGWYLRGDVGVGFQNFKSFDHSQTNPAFVWPASWTINQQEIKDATILGFGVGYEFNSWLRFDITGEYRTKVVGKVTGSFKEFCAGGGTCFDSFDFDHSAAVFMANAYIDLGTWWCITPYIGGGVGAAFERITGLTDVGHNADGTSGFGLTSGDSAAWGLVERSGGPHLQRHQQFQGGLQLALPEPRLAAKRRRLLSNPSSTVRARRCGISH